MSAPDPNTLFKACQAYIRQGQPVFPCKVTGKKAKAPLTPNGLLDATLDKERVRRWWTQVGHAAIGIPTGIVWDVLDVDIKEGQDGRRWLPELHRLGLLNGCQRVVKTPSGGWHLYFPVAQGLTNKAAGAQFGLDVRAKGGYVLAPPSYLTDAESSDGTIYSGAYVDFGPTEDATTEPLLWDLIVSNIMPKDTDTNKPIPLLPSERRASVAALREWLSNRSAGERNNSLHWAVCRCIDSGIDPHEMLDAALLIGLDEGEARLTINSALRRAGVKIENLNSEAEALFPTQ